MEERHSSACRGLERNDDRCGFCCGRGADGARRGAGDIHRCKGVFCATYITEGLHSLLVLAVKRLSGKGGSPVVQLQTSFGGGKTHTMIALYHLLHAQNIAELTGAADILGLPPK